MKDLQHASSFTAQLSSSKKPRTKRLVEDVANFSYLVEDGLAPGEEFQTYYDFVSKLVDDATRFSEEAHTYPYMKNTKGSAGQDLHRLTNELSCFQQEMDKIERELTTLDYGPKEYAILEVVVRTT